MHPQLSKVGKIIWKCYIDIYKNSIPLADFEKLVEEAKINERGEKVIDFNSYIIDEKIFYEIIDNNCKQKRLYASDKQCIKNSLLLGCTPKFA